MELVDVLQASQHAVLWEASVTLRRAHLTHAQACQGEEAHERLEHVFVLVLDCLTRESLSPITRYATTVAEDCFSAGFDIGEVLTEFDAVEDSIWHFVVLVRPINGLVEATNKICTVFGAARTALARAWVSLATAQHAPALDLTVAVESAST